MSLINDGYTKLDNLLDYSNKKLCEIIIINRYLGSMFDDAINCMQELAKRRANGDNFDYENYIENELKKLPDFKINLQNKIQIGLDLSLLKGIK